MGIFGRRDGKKIKGIDGFSRMASLLVGEDRVQSTNYFTQEVFTKTLDEYIAKKRDKEGVEYTYRDIAIATLVRVFYLRPRLNRFVVKGTFYQRNFIDVSMTVHKSLKTGDQETAIKCRFDGTETLAQVKEKLDKEINRAVYEQNDTDAFTGGFWGKTPTFMLRFMVWMLRKFDRWGWLTDKFMFTTSPFHCSIFFADLKSINLATVWHHLYNFGNCGFFCSMGRDTIKPIVDQKTGLIRAENMMELGISQDERFTDGLLYTHMIKAIGRILENLDVLDRPGTEEERKWPKK